MIARHAVKMRHNGQRAGSIVTGGNFVTGGKFVTGGNFATGGKFVTGGNIVAGGKVATGRAATNALFGTRAERAEYGSLRGGRSCGRRSCVGLPCGGPSCGSRSLGRTGCTSVPFEHRSVRTLSSAALVAIDRGSRTSGALVSDESSRALLSTSFASAGSSRALVLASLVCGGSRRAFSSASLASDRNSHASSSASLASDDNSRALSSASLVSAGSSRAFSSASPTTNGNSLTSASLVRCGSRRGSPSASLVSNGSSRALLLTSLASDDTSRALSPASPVSAGSSRAFSSASPTTDGNGRTSASMVGYGSRRGFPSASLASDGRDISVVEQGTERFLVAQRQLAGGDVLFDCTPGTLSSVRSRHSIQVAADLHLTVSDDLQLISHGCTPNCQLEVVEGSSKDGEGPCVRVTAIAPEILKGEVLTIDYNAMEVDMISSFDCACGAINCRGRISGFSRLPPSVQEEYIRGRWSTSAVGAGGSGAPPLLTGVVKDWVASARGVRGS